MLDLCWTYAGFMCSLTEVLGAFPKDNNPRGKPRRETGNLESGKIRHQDVCADSRLTVVCMYRYADLSTLTCLRLLISTHEVL